MSRIISDADMCVGCLACVVTCMDHHYAGDDPNAVSYRKYRTFDLPRGLTQYLTESCRHCSDAPCIDACPVGSPVFDGEGKSLRCDGCLACVQICPNGALRLES